MSLGTYSEFNTSIDVSVADNKKDGWKLHEDSVANLGGLLIASDHHRPQLIGL